MDEVNTEAAYQAGLKQGKAIAKFFSSPVGKRVGNTLTYTLIGYTVVTAMSYAMLLSAERVIKSVPKTPVV